jgi:hypothetical protein
MEGALHVSHGNGVCGGTMRLSIGHSKKQIAGDNGWLFNSFGP